MSESRVLKKLHVHTQDESTLPTMENISLEAFEGWMFASEIRYDRILVRRAFTHVADVRHFMESLWKVAAPGAQLAIITPYGSSDSAHEDLEAKRVVFKETYKAFWPKWKYVRRVFLLDSAFFSPEAEDVNIGLAVANLRNVVKEFAVDLQAQKGDLESVPGQNPQTAFKFV